MIYNYVQGGGHQTSWNPGREFATVHSIAVATGYEQHNKESATVFQKIHWTNIINFVT